MITNQYRAFRTYNKRVHRRAYLINTFWRCSQTRTLLHILIIVWPNKFNMNECFNMCEAYFKNLCTKRIINWVCVLYLHLRYFILVFSHFPNQCNSCSLICWAKIQNLQSNGMDLLTGSSCFTLESDVKWTYMHSTLPFVYWISIVDSLMRYVNETRNCVEQTNRWLSRLARIYFVYGIHRMNMRTVSTFSCEAWNKHSYWASCLQTFVTASCWGWDNHWKQQSSLLAWNLTNIISLWLYFCRDTN